MFAKTWVLIILAPHFSILQTFRVYFSHSSCHHLLFTLLRQRSSLSCNKSLVQHSGLFHMMPKWWTSATCRDLPTELSFKWFTSCSIKRKLEKSEITRSEMFTGRESAANWQTNGWRLLQPLVSVHSLQVPPATTIPLLRAQQVWFYLRFRWNDTTALLCDCWNLIDASFSLLSAGIVHLARSREWVENCRNSYRTLF